MATNYRQRYSSASWAEELRTILIIGLGGIGNGLAQQLAAIGHKLVLQDHDIVSTENLFPQKFMISQLNTPKVLAAADLIEAYYGVKPFYTIETKFDEKSTAYPITMSCVDNMTARKLIFEAWKKLDNRELLLDGRMSGEAYSLYVVTKETEDEYAKTLYEDSDIADAPCTYKITAFVAANIQSEYTQALCNYLSDMPLEFKYEYVGQINLRQWT